MTYNSEWNYFELDGYELQCGESVEVSVFGYWIPGQIALDTGGWYLFTLDQVRIRLQSGLPARLCESSGGALPPLVHASQMHPPHILKPIDRDYFVAALDHAIQTRQLRRQVVEQQLALELHTKSLEHLVQQQTHELVEANATKDQIIRIVSHELNMPLAHLKEMTQLLSQKLEVEDVAEIVVQGLADIEDAIRRTEVLVQQLLDTSRIETTTFILHRKRRDLVALCQSALEEYAARTGAALVCEGLAAPLEAEVDVDRLRQLVLALLSNAREHSTKGLPITLTLQQTDNTAIIIVSDIGSGSALGLDYYVWRKMVEQLGGRLEFQSFADNRSSCFIMLPHRSEHTTEHTGAVKHSGGTKAAWVING